MDIKYSNAELQKMLEKLSKKRYDYRRNRGWLDDKYKDIFQQSGLFKEGFGYGKRSVISAQELIDRKGVNINYTIGMLEQMLDRNYIKNIDISYKESIVIQLKYMGMDKLANQFDNLSLKNFRKEFIKTRINIDFKEFYDNYKSLRTAEQFIENKSFKREQEKIVKEVKKFLGY